MLVHLDECNYACITTNAMIRKDNHLVMGRGIAQQVRDSFPGIAEDLGTSISLLEGKLPKYGLLRSKLYPSMIAFQVKYHWHDEADLELIKYSTTMLTNGANKNTNRVYFLNFPGIGNGKLSREDVLPIIEQLPNNVTIWEY